MQLGHFLDGHEPAKFTDRSFKTLSEAPGLGEPGKGLLLYHPAALAEYPSVFKLQVDPYSSGVHVADSVDLTVIESARRLAA